MADGRAFEGDRALQDIAEAGREWRQNHVRKADMEVRLLPVCAESLLTLCGGR